MGIGQGDHAQGDDYAEAYDGQCDPLGGGAPLELVAGEGDGLGDDGAQVAVDDLDAGQEAQDPGGPRIQTVRWRPPRHLPGSHSATQREREQGSPDADGRPVLDGLHHPPSV